MSKTLVVLNPRAAQGKAAQIFPQVETELRAAGLDFDVVQTRAPRHAVELAQAAPGQGYEGVIAVGGDGSVHEVMNGLLRASNEGETIALGIIPLGTGNDFIKSLPPPLAPGKNRDNWRQAISRLTSGKTILVDVGKLTGDCPAPGYSMPQYFTNGADVGFGARVAKAIRHVPFTGKPGYMFAVLQVLADYGLPRIKLTLDDTEVIELNTTITAVTNGRCFGSSFWLTPMAEITDGEFDVFIGSALGRIGILQVLPKIMKGTHLNHPAASFKKARKVVIESAERMTVEADGELPFLEAHRIQIQVLPQRLRVMI
ncbi:MAG TPA: diacylglycerol kinase family protein [Anaerolineae bacterium]|nr:diacylglycerol kinase family protein [Anaerolineae bacterium]